MLKIACISVRNKQQIEVMGSCEIQPTHGITDHFACYISL